MESKFNVGFMANGEILGCQSDAIIAYGSDGLIVAGKLNTGGKSLAAITGDLLNNLPKEISQSAVISKNTEKNSTAYFVLKNKVVSLLASGDGINIGITGGKEWNIIAAVDAKKLSAGNSFERFVSETARWIAIERIVMIAKSKTTQFSGLDLAGKLSGFQVPSIVPADAFKKYQLVAGGEFFFKNNSFLGTALNVFTGLEKMSLFVGGNFDGSGIAASLVADTIETGILKIKGFSLKISKDSTFCISAEGEITLKLGAGISFKLSGNITQTSFMLSASSLASTKLHLTNKLFFKDLNLAIGYNKVLTLGMTGRLTSNNLSIFAGFNIVCSSPPVVNLLTAAITTTTGRLSLKTLIEEIAAIKANGLDALDIIAIKDFDLNNVKLDESINDTISEDDAEKLFNKKIHPDMKIAKGNTQLTPLGNRQYIITDKGRMRHYRINENGVVSLNCQIFICTSQLKLGQYDIKPGFFICGTLELFGKNIRFLFQVEKEVSLTALVQMDPISIGKVIEITASDKKPPIAPINGGLAGQLVSPNTTGLTFYLKVSKNSGVNCYITAKINILSVFKLDALVIIRDRYVYIDIETSHFGFKLIINICAAYQSFSDATFGLKIVFDTSDFLEIVQKACQWMRNTAKEITDTIEKAKRELTNAEKKVLSLKRQISDLDSRIAGCRSSIKNASWWKKAFVAIAKGAEILAYEVAKGAVYVAMGVAVAAIEVAKAALSFGGAVVSTVLNSLAFILNAATNLLWIKSFELSVSANSSERKFATKLTFIIMGMEKTISASINAGNSNAGNSLNSDIKGLISSSLDGESKKAIEDAKKGKVSRDFLTDGEEIPEECYNLHEARLRYLKGCEMMERAEDLFLDIETAYIDIYGELDDMAQTAACNIAKVKMEYESNYSQMVSIFDNDFAEAVNTINDNMPVQRSESVSAHMSSLLGIAEEYSAGASRFNSLKKESLMSRLEKESKQAYYATKSRQQNDSDIPASNKNKNMADIITHALDKHFGDVADSDNDFINLRKEEMILDSISLLRFSGRRTKQKRPPKTPDSNSNGYISRMPPTDEE